LLSIEFINGPKGSREKIVKMSSFVGSLCVLVTLSGTAVANSADEGMAAAVTKGSMLVTASGARLAPVYRVGADGAAQIILDGKMVTVPAATLSYSSGRLTTSLTKNEVLALP
jgi:hypothetical protein